MNKPGVVRFFIILIIVALFSGCRSSRRGGNGGGVTLTNSWNRGIPVDSGGLPGKIFTDPPQEREKTWNFLVYMNGDNNLEEFALDDLEELERVGSSDNVNVLVLCDRHPGYDTSNGNWTGAKLFYIERDNDISRITSKCLHDLGEVNMAHPATLRDFIVYCQEKYPATYTVLILWDHGDGVTPRAIRGTGEAGVVFRGISTDWTSGFNEWACLTTDEVASALREAYNRTGQKIEIINMDACLMQTIEVAYEWRDEVDYLVGSPGEVPAAGNDYQALLEKLNDDVSVSPREFACEIVNIYHNTYKNGTYSALSLGGEFIELIKKVQNFSSQLRKASAFHAQIREARKKTISFGNYGEYADLYSFAHEVADIPVLQGATSELQEALERAVINNQAAKGYGLNIFFPTPEHWAKSSSVDRYRYLEFCADTDWDEFLSVLNRLSPELYAVRLRWPSYDCDLGIIEPDGSYYTSYNSYSPNGIFSPDLKDGGEEAWVLKESHAYGTYTPFMESHNYTGTATIIVEIGSGGSAFELPVEAGYRYIFHNLQVNLTRGTRTGIAYDLRVEPLQSGKD
ncbi:MAG TPA: clostripain-related cysteine peptidase [Bacillota bacterium]